MVTTEESGRPWVVVAWFAALLAAVWLFAWMGRGTLAAPPMGDADALRQWFGDRAPHEVVFAGGRLLVLGLAWYLLGALTIGVIARVCRAARLVAVADFLTIDPVRHLLQGAFGLGLAAAAVTSAGSAPLFTGAGSAAHASMDDEIEGDTPDDGPQLRLTERLQAPASAADQVDGEAPTLDDAVGDVELAARRLTTEASGDRAMALLPPALDPGALEISLPEATSSTPSVLDAEAPPLDDGESAGSRYIVAPGDHLWDIAEAALVVAVGEAPSDAEVATYWQQVIEVNRDRLPDPGNPDFIYPGLEIELPPTSAS